MDSVTLRDFRCFRGEQTARMAPLTLLVGENSTGKTSFLAILRALWEVAVFETVPDFRRDPYDLGAFSEIVYNDSSRGEQPDSFQAGFRDSDTTVSFHFTFQDVDGVAFPSSRHMSVGDTSFEVSPRPDQSTEFRIGIGDRNWKVGSTAPVRVDASRGEWLYPIDSTIWYAYDILRGDYRSSDSIREATRQYEERSLDKDNIERIREAQEQLGAWRFNHSATFAGAPVRSKPRRTYDPSRPITDSEGEYIPSYLSMMSRRDPNAWKKLKERLEEFGSESGLFDEISIESFGRTDDAAPFQIQIRKFGGKLKGNRRNMIDVGYGVSQALPIITELLRPEASSMSLLQQPEVHLHPSVQAALGSLFCSIAGPDRQLVVETHSDYLVNRVRMDVRDGKTDLKPEDVSILYFERGESGVEIHSIRMDNLGNVLDAPTSYGEFFMEETRRSIGI